LAEGLDLDAESITLENNLKEDLGADSLDMVDLIMSIEDAFDIKIEEEDTAGIKTVGDIVSYIEAHS
ncbi:MAG: acyl carrier protein, partial [Clostridiales bacterium]|nr:acyl carrier protein [Clostridiales bacterium]